MDEVSAPQQDEPPSLRGLYNAILNLALYAVGLDTRFPYHSSLSFGYTGSTCLRRCIVFPNNANQSLLDTGNHH